MLTIIKIYLTFIFLRLNESIPSSYRKIDLVSFRKLTNIEII